MDGIIGILETIGQFTIYLAIGSGIAVGYAFAQVNKFFAMLKPLHIKIFKDKTVSLKRGTVKDGKVYWGKKKDIEHTTHLTNVRYAEKPFGRPVFVEIEGKGENIDIYEKFKPQSSDIELSNMFLSYLQRGRELERKNQQGIQLDMKFLILFAAVLGILGIIAAKLFGLLEGVI